MKNTNFTNGIAKIKQVDREITANPSKYPQGRFKPKSCKICKETFEPQGPSHHYCCKTCRKLGKMDTYYKNKYGVSIHWVIEQLEKQGWKCLVCREEGFKMRGDHISGLNVDHCHTNLNVRGLLCHNCNRGLGLFRDNTDYLRRAALYLESKIDTRGNEKPD